MTEVIARSNRRTWHRPEKLLGWAWLASNLGVVMFYAAVRNPHIDPVCSASPWSALAWTFAVLAFGGLLLAVIGVVMAVREGGVAPLALWTAALLISGVQVVFAVMAAHMATIPCGLPML